MADLVLPIQALATGFMAGLIWFVQVVHYPLMARVGPAGFRRYEAAHTRRTGLVVGPVMALEALGAALLVAAPPPGVAPGEAWALLAMLGAIWGVTAFFSVPMHGRLAAGFDPEAHRSLVRTNWMRTALWTARALWLAALLARE